MRALLQPVERDLHHELGANVHDVAVVLAPRLSRQQLRSLPAQQLVREPLERLAEHDVTTGRGVARAEPEVREQPLTPPRAPLGREHDEVERVRRLDLEPARTAAASLVGRAERLGDEPSWPRASASSKNDSAASAESGTRCGTRFGRGQQPLERLASHRLLAVEDVVAVAVQTIEEDRRQRQLGAQCVDVEPATEPAHRHLERLRPAVRPQREHFAIEHEPFGRQRAHELERPRARRR